LSTSVSAVNGYSIATSIKLNAQDAIARIVSQNTLTEGDQQLNKACWCLCKLSVNMLVSETYRASKIASYSPMGGHEVVASVAGVM